MLTGFIQDSDFIVVLQTAFRSGSGFLPLGSALESDSKKTLSPNTSGAHQRWPESFFRPLLFLNFWIRVRYILQIWESDSCSESGYNHQSNRNLSMFLPRKWPHRLLPKWKSDSGSCFSQIFDSGSGFERKSRMLPESTTVTRIRSHLLRAWSRLWILWIRTPTASNRIRSKVFFPVDGSGLDVNFVCWKNVTGCLLDLYFPGLEQESNCLNIVVTSSGLDSDSRFAKHDWIQTRKIRVRTPLVGWGYMPEVSMDRIRIGYPSEYLRFFRIRIGFG